jgi:hypothetical protein
MNFYDFQIRAWLVNEDRAQVLVHSSPIGGMRKPLTVNVDPAKLNTFRHLVDEVWSGPAGATNKVIAVGTELASILLPPKVDKLLNRSLDRIEPEDGLRVRLCLDDELIDLPWEYLYRRDESEEERLDGFIVLNSRISLVREPPSPLRNASVSDEPQRLVFAGAPHIQADGTDSWRVGDEYRRLLLELKPVIDSGFLSFDPFHNAAGVNIESALTEPAAFFHYSGHTDEDGGEFYLAKAVDSGKTTERLSTEMLGTLLRRAQTKLAVFSACNGGQWGFVKPLLDSGLPALIGIQGLVSSGAAIWFCQILYRAIALGLSLDEAVTWARLDVLKAGSNQPTENVEWGSFMVYMPVAEAVLIPKLKSPALREQQQVARDERAQTVTNVTNIITQNIQNVQSGAHVTGMINRTGSPKDNDP